MRAARSTVNVRPSPRSARATTSCPIPSSSATARMLRPAARRAVASPSPSRCRSSLARRAPRAAALSLPGTVAGWWWSLIGGSPGRWIDHPTNIARGHSQKSVWLGRARPFGRHLAHGSTRWRRKRDVTAPGLATRAVHRRMVDLSTNGVGSTGSNVGHGSGRPRSARAARSAWARSWIRVHGRGAAASAPARYPLWRGSRSARCSR